MFFTTKVLCYTVYFYKNLLQCCYSVANSDDAMKLDFLQEMAMMKRVSAGKNPYIVNMIGCCSIQEPLALVLELISNGNLLDYLKANRVFVRNTIVIASK